MSLKVVGPLPSPPPPPKASWVPVGSLLQPLLSAQTGAGKRAWEDLCHVPRTTLWEGKASSELDFQARGKPRNKG